MTMTAECKSPTHKRYGQAVEGLYIQTWLAHLEFGGIMKEVETGSDVREKGRFLLSKQHKLDEVIERIQFGRSELAEAERAVNAHFDRAPGCRNVVG